MVLYKITVITRVTSAAVPQKGQINNQISLSCVFFYCITIEIVREDGWVSVIGS